MIPIHERSLPAIGEACSRLVLLIVATLLIAPAAGADPESEAGIVPLGRGSYTTNLPESIQLPPREIYKLGDLPGATPTNQWWSSVAWEEFSHNLFPHPLGMVCTQEGLSISHPGASIVSASGHIMGGGVSENGDLVLGLSTVDRFGAARLAGHSRWFITVEFKDDGGNLRASFGHGSPFVYCRHGGGKPQVRIGEKPIVWSAEGGTIGLTVRGNHYGLFGPAGSRWSGTDGQLFTNHSGKDFFTVALLPDNRPETLALFARYAHNHVVDTRVSFTVADGFVETDYRLKTESLEGDAEGAIFALYPHHWKYSDTPLNGMSYPSVRGTMKVAQGSGFRTRVPMQGVLPMLPAEGIPDRDRMIDYLNAEASKPSPPFGDTYWEGKHLGKLATLSGIAEAIGEDELQRRFVGEIRSRLEDWFTASPDEDSPLFYYDDRWGSLIGSKPSYGSDSQLNDHHFHYGYFIRAAAEVARLDPQWAKEWGPMVNLLIRDIASTVGDDPLFPELRCFDLYAGHSWASGHAMFADGNNQESSSESLNAWYAIMLWGEATGDTQLRDAGAFLYNTERTAVEEYWFDVSATNFPKDFPNVALGMIWGGKGAFGTWFSSDIDCVHGINWLPFTPASIYMGRHPDYVRKNHDRIIQQREGGDDYNNGWGDLVVMFHALSDPADAAAYIDATPDCKTEDGNTHAFMYHWIHTLDRLGLNDASVTADYPFYNVYLKDGKRTYAVYNFQDSPITVNFSDGAELLATPKRLSIQTESTR